MMDREKRRLREGMNELKEGMTEKREEWWEPREGMAADESRME